MDSREVGSGLGRGGAGMKCRRVWAARRAAAAWVMAAAVKRQAVARERAEA